MSLVYLDMIKLAIPTCVRGSAPNAEAQYVMFGTYDMLYYKLPDETCPNPDMTWMEEQHERRHDLDWNCERHPVHLYVPNDYSRRAVEVLNEKVNTASPLVLTMVRINKHPLPTLLELDSTLEMLQYQVDALASGYGGLSATVCWNLGNADFLILCRCQRLSDYKELLVSLNMRGFRITKTGNGRDSSEQDAIVEFMSFSSYCAFPKGSGTTQVNEGDLTTWLNAEKGLRFINFVDSVADQAAILDRFGPSRLLFGDRDYQLFSDENTTDLVKAIRSIVDEMLVVRPEKTTLVYSSSLIPSLPVTNTTQHGEGTEGHSDLTEMHSRWKKIESACGSVKDKLQGISDFINNSSDVYHNLAGGYVNEISHCVNTLDALYKYAIRLYAAAYQDDVHSVIQGLYEALGQVLTNLHEYMETLLGNLRKLQKRPHSPCEELENEDSQEKPEDNDELLKKHERSKELQKELIRTIPVLYAEVMRFVSELQHVYTVLAISPHSHMETYYGSMRSLNASSKLWTSYNGVINALCTLFPTNNQGEHQRCKVLLVPYREKPSQSSRIVPDTYSKSILISMQINYQMMFDTKSTLFVIAHELGHYVFNKTRKERAKLMFRDVAATVFHNRFSDVMECPLFTMANAPRTRGSKASESIIKSYKILMAKATSGTGNVEDLRKALCLRMCCNLDADKCNRIYALLTNQLREMYTSALRELMDVVEKEFDEWYATKAREESKYSFYYGDDIERLIASFADEYTRNYSRAAYRTIAEANTIFLQNIVSIERTNNVRFDRNQIVKLKTYWSHESMYGKARTSRTPGEGSELSKTCITVLELFREVHAEIFACRVTGFSHTDYLAHVASFADFSPDLLDSLNNLYRIMTVCEIVFCDTGCSSFMEWLSKETDCPFDTLTRKDTKNKVQITLSDPLYRYIREYGSVVNQSIGKQIEVIRQDSNRDKLLDDIQNFAKGSAEVPQQMWRFWLQVMEETTQGDHYEHER